MRVRLAAKARDWQRNATEQERRAPSANRRLSAAVCWQTGRQRRRCWCQRRRRCGGGGRQCEYASQPRHATGNATPLSRNDAHPAQTAGSVLQSAGRLGGSGGAAGARGGGVGGGGGRQCEYASQPRHAAGNATPLSRNDAHPAQTAGSVLQSAGRLGGSGGAAGARGGGVGGGGGRQCEYASQPRHAAGNATPLSRNDAHPAQTAGSVLQSAGRPGGSGGADGARGGGGGGGGGRQCEYASQPRHAAGNATPLSRNDAHPAQTAGSVLQSAGRLGGSGGADGARGGGVGGGGGRQCEYASQPRHATGNATPLSRNDAHPAQTAGSVLQSAGRLGGSGGADGARGGGGGRRWRQAVRVRLAAKARGWQRNATEQERRAPSANRRLSAAVCWQTGRQRRRCWCQRRRRRRRWR